MDYQTEEYLELTMINGIKIYNKDGILKQEISSEKARQLYNDSNKGDWELTPTQRRVWNGIRVEDKENTGYIKTGLQVWVKRKYKKRVIRHKVICLVCKKETLKASPTAKYCSRNCFDINRRSKKRKVEDL